MANDDTISLINLTAGNFYVDIAPEVGGSIARFGYRENAQKSGRHVDIFRPLANLNPSENRVLDMGCFPLIPYSNRIRDGKMKSGSKTVSWHLNNPPEPHSIHGTGWQSTWKPRRVTSCSLVLDLAPDTSSDIGAPFLFKASQHIVLTPQQLEITLSVTNLDNGSFPVGLGLHPYFPDREHAEITAYLPHEWMLDAHSMPVVRRANQHQSLFLAGKKAQGLKQMSAYCGWDGTAVLRWPQSGVELAMTAQPIESTELVGPPASHLLMWAPEGETFFCVEPTTHGIDGFNLQHAEQGHTDKYNLAPRQTRTQKFIFRPKIAN